MNTLANKLKILIFLFLLFSLSRNCFAQMSGTFTIGGTNPDFENFYEAIASVCSNGVSGNVVFNVRPGNYPGFTITTIPVVGSNDTITFQAENQDPTSVIITGTVKFISTSNIALKNLTIHPFPGQTNTCITIDKSDKILFSHCRIEKTDNVNFSPDNALISLKYDWTGNVKSAKFSHSYISSELRTILIDGVKGKIDFEYDTINGAIHDNFGHPIKNYLHNTLYLNEGDMDIMNQYFEGNQIYLGSYYNWLSITGNVKGNEFYSTVHITASIVYNNLFHEPVTFSHSTMKMVENISEKETYVNFCHNSFFYFNKFFGDCKFSSDNQKVISNFFYGKAVFTTGPNQMIHHNNFGLESKLEIYLCSAKVKNNILVSDTIMQPLGTEMVNNNFIPCPTCQLTMIGDDASFYDAMYVSDSDLHATSPVLIHKAIPLQGYYYDYDIDSTLRQAVASIGANEVCLNFPIAEIEQRCNDFVCLDACIDDFTGYYWAPSWMFADSSASSPILHLETSDYVYLCHIDTGVVGSMFINVTPDKPLANQSHTANLFTVDYTNLSYCSTSVKWEFGDNTFSTLWAPTHTFPGSGIFHSKLIAYNQLGSDTCKFDTQILIVSQDENPENSFKIYPNPVETDITIEFGNFVKPYLLNIFDPLGRLVHQSNGSQKLEHIDLSGFKPGIYFFKIEMGQQIFTKKILVK
jgi:hypothetical protein